MANGMYPAYAAVGEDEAKRDAAVARLKTHVDEGLADFNIAEYRDPAHVSGQDLVDSLDQLPFGAPLRLVIVHGADRLPKEASDAVVAYLKDPNPQTVLLLTANKLAKNTRLYKAVAGCGPKAVIDCSLPKTYQMPALVAKICRGKGVVLGPGAAEEILSRVGESTVMLETVATQLADRFGAGAPVGVDQVRAEVARIVEPKPWHFCDAVCERDLKGALEIYARFPDNSEILLHTFLTGRVRELLCARCLDASGRGGALASELGKPAWMVKNHLRWSRRFSEKELVDALAAAARCERTLKGPGSSRTAFVAWVASVCAGDRASSASHASPSRRQVG